MSAVTEHTASAGGEEDDTQKQITGAEEETRVSDIRPRNWESLFPANAKPAEGKKPTANRLLVAGGLHATDLDLQRMQVVVRIRPMTVRDSERGSCVHAYAQSCLAMAPPEGSKSYRGIDREEEDNYTNFTFSRVFGPEAGQVEFYRATAAPMVRGLMESGLSSVLMAYGVSGAGKTYTMEGVPGDWGVIFLSIQSIFEEASREDQMEKPTVKISHYEIYCEKVHDLLANAAPAGIGPMPKPLGPQPALNIRDDAKGRVIVESLTEIAVGSTAEAYRILRHSCRQERKRAPTGLNDWSSRSHSIVTVAVYMPQVDLPGSVLADAQSAHVSSSGTALTPWGRLSFVDLAGNERADRTGNMGARMEESKAINKSLFNLQACLKELRWNQQNAAEREPRNVPYRASKLTHLLRDVLHGWGQLLMCVNVSPAARDYEATVDTLRYATLARRIGTTARAQPPVRAIKAKTPNITKKWQARRSMHPRPANALGTIILKAPAEAAVPKEDADSDDEAPAQLGSKGAMLPSEARERLMDLEAEVEELRELLAEAEAERVRLEEHQVVIADVVRGEVCDEWRLVIDRMAEEHEAKRAEEVKALKERHQKEVATLEKQLQKAAGKPGKKLKKGRAGSPLGSSGQDILEQENAALRQQVDDLQRTMQEWKKEIAVTEQAQAEAAQATERHTELQTALRTQSATRLAADEALAGFQAASRADAAALEARLDAAEAASWELREQLQEAARTAAQERTDAAQRMAVLQAELAAQMSAKEASEKAAAEAAEAFIRARAAAEATEVEVRAELDAGRVAWEGERQVLEQRLKQQQVDLEDQQVQAKADSSMKVHMLERELARAQKDIVALRCQLACQRDCPPGSAATNPAVLRTAAEAAQNGPKVRGAAGTPHNIALARAIAEAQLSPLQSPPVSQPAATQQHPTDAAGIPSSIPSFKVPMSQQGAAAAEEAVPATAAEEAAMPDQAMDQHTLAPVGAMTLGDSAGAVAARSPEKAACSPRASAKSEGSAPHAAAEPEQAADGSAPAKRQASKRRSTAPSRPRPVQLSKPAQMPAVSTQVPATRLTRRASMAAASTSSAAAGGKRPRNVNAAQGEEHSQRRVRSRGASMAIAPEQSAEARQPPRERVWQKTGISSAAAPAPGQDAMAQVSFAGSMPALCSLATIDEMGGIEDGVEEVSNTSRDASADENHAMSTAAPAAAESTKQMQEQGDATTAEQVAAGENDGLCVRTAEHSDVTPVEEEAGSQGQQDGSQRQQDGSQQLATTAAAGQAQSKLVSMGPQTRGEPAKRSTRWANMVARPGSARKLPTDPLAGLSLVLEHSSAADGDPAPTASAKAEKHSEEPPQPDPAPARRRTASKENAAAGCSLPASARSQKPSAPVKPEADVPVKRSRKRKLLPGKQADKATAEALCGELDPEALPLRALATPVAMRTRRTRHH